MSISGIGSSIDTSASAVNATTASASATENAAEVQALLGGSAATAPQLSAGESAQTFEDSMLLGVGSAPASGTSVDADYVYQALMIKAGAGISVPGATASASQAASSYNATSAQTSADSAIIDSIA